MYISVYSSIIYRGGFSFFDEKIKLIFLENFFYESIKSIHLNPETREYKLVRSVSLKMAPAVVNSSK